MPCAISGVICWMLTPTQPLRAAPYCFSWPMMSFTRLEGIEKPMPTEPPLGEKMAEFTPTTLPSISNSGPPELPRLMGASVWMKSS